MCSRGGGRLSALLLILSLSFSFALPLSQGGRDPSALRSGSPQGWPHSTLLNRSPGQIAAMRVE